MSRDGGRHILYSTPYESLWVYWITLQLLYSLLLLLLLFILLYLIFYGDTFISLISSLLLVISSFVFLKKSISSTSSGSVWQHFYRIFYLFVQLMDDFSFYKMIECYFYCYVVNDFRCWICCYKVDIWVVFYCIYLFICVRSCSLLSVTFLSL